MAKYLNALFKAREPMFSIGVRSLERRAGSVGVDVAYIADIMQRAHEAMRKIGLDPADTTKLELYKSLAAHLESPSLFKTLDDVYLVVAGDVISFNKNDVRNNATKTYELRENTSVRHHVAHGLLERYVKSGLSRTEVERLFGEAGLELCSDGFCEIAPTTKKNESKDAPNLLFIGDIFTDAFIKLDEKTTKVIDEGDGVKWLAVPFGQKPKYEKVDIVRSVGPSPNAAVSCARLGLQASLMAWIGGDDVGKEALAHLTKEGVGTDTMVTERDKVTSYWYVLNYKADRTMLVKSEKYKYEWRDPKTTPDWIYLSYVGEDSWPLHVSLLGYLERHPNIKFVFQPGTFQFAWGAKKLKALYARSHSVIMNREEAVQVTGADYNSLKDLADALHAIGPEIVVITDGPAGSYASFDGKLYNMPNYPDPAPPLERTGAGDAFASTFIAALALGESVETALTWAPINSMNVVQHIGAQKGLLTKKKLLEYLKNAPKNYKIKELQ